MAPTEPRLYLDAGWDPALKTYYAQVWLTVDPASGEEPDHPLLWVGTSDRQHRSLPELRAALGPYARLLRAGEALDLELERSLKEDEIDEDDLNAFLATGPSDEQLRAYLHEQRAARRGDFAQLDETCARRAASRSAEHRQRALLRLPWR